MARLTGHACQADRKVTVTQLTTHYNSSMQNTQHIEPSTRWATAAENQNNK